MAKDMGLGAIVDASCKRHIDEFSSEILWQKNRPANERFYSSTSLDDLNRMGHHKNCFIRSQSQLDSLRAAIGDGSLQELLSEDRAAREIIKILCSARGNLGTPIFGYDGDYSRVRAGNYVTWAKVFTKKSGVTDESVRERLGLLVGIGLVVPLKVDRSTTYCLQTEYGCHIWLPYMSHGDYATCEVCIDVSANPDLRKGLDNILSPFKAEKHQYKLKIAEDKRR